MAVEWLAALEATTLARALRDSVWIYPLVNAGHILGVALLVGSIIPLDLRLLGVWRSVPLEPLWRVLRRTAAAGLAMAVCFGLPLFMSRATEYAASRFFLAKMTLVALAIVNAALLTVAGGRHAGLAMVRTSWRLRGGAGISLIAWLTVLVLGRLVGYF